MKIHNLDIQAEEITLQEAQEKYPVYPKVNMIVNDYLFDILTYIPTDNKYLAPLRLRLKDYMGNRVADLSEVNKFILDVMHSAEAIKTSFNGWSHFEGKSNFVYKDGVVVSIKKLI